MVIDASAAGGEGSGCRHGDADRLAPRRRGATGRGACRLGFRLALAEHQNLVEQRHVGRLGARLQFGQLFGVVSLEAHVIHARFAAAGGDGEIDARVVEHPLGVVALQAARLRGKQLRVEGDALGKIVDMDMDVEAFHGDSLGQHLQGVATSGRHTSPWQHFSVR